MFREARPAAGGPRAAAGCYHCALPLPPRTSWTAEIAGAPRAFCCAGCLAVAQTIAGAGLSAYYRDRPQPAAAFPRNDAESAAPTYDDAVAARAGWLRRRDDGTAEISLLLEGVTCGACVWLIETWLQRQAGVLDAAVNLALRRAVVRVDPQRIALGQLLTVIGDIGYRAHPYDPARREALARREGRVLLRRTALALLAMMQIMMLALPTYLGSADVAPADRRLLDWASLTLTFPVLLYCAAPFFTGALRDLRRRRLGMDVPVALAIAAAFAGSLAATVHGAGATYYDSISMFVALLLLARLLEHRARQRAADALELTARVVPMTAERYRAYGEDDALDPVAAEQLCAGDVVCVRPGALVPADGIIVEGQSHVDESWLTGEALPRRCGQGDRALAGAINRDGMLVLRVQHAGESTQIALLSHLVAAAAAARPPLAQAADRIAGIFTAVMLGVAAAAALYWMATEPGRALAVTFAVLAVSCPCALSLATPAALTAAAGALARRHIVVSRPEALEALAHVNHVAFDKTGTLTQGTLALTAFVALRPLTREHALSIAAALEHASEHPLARALRSAAPVRGVAAQPRNRPGEGVEGVVEGHAWRLGRIDFVAASSTDGLAAGLAAMPPSCTVVALGDDAGVAALLGFADVLREEAPATVRTLTHHGVATSMLSGDRAGTVQWVGAQAGITDVHGALRPEDKRAAIAGLQQRGAIVAMVGDGVNDAPALAAADVGISLGSATPLAQTSADLVMLDGRLDGIPAALAIARRTRHVIRENLGWALVYNVAALPAAACGFVTPLMASAGMAVSSIIVVANALRAGRGTAG